MTGFQVLMWVGAVVTLAGVAGLMATAVRAWKLRQLGLPDDQIRAALHRAVVWNMAALLIATIGLMMVVLGIALG